MEKQSALDKISELEKYLLDFQQKHPILQGGLLDAKKELKLCKLKFAGKCSALSKASKLCEDKKDSSKNADKIIVNEHPNDIIDVTQYDIDSNFPKRLMFGKLHYGSLSNRKMKSKGKIDTYARINFKKGFNDVSNKKQRDRARFLHAILVHMANGGQDHTQKMLALLLKSSPSTVVKKSIEDAGFKLFREMEVYQAVQLKSLLHLPMNMYKRMQRLLSNFGYSHKFLPSHHRILAEQKKLVPHITKATFATEKIYLNSMGEKSQFITVIFVKDLIQYISSIVEDLEKQKKLQFENFDDNLWLLFSDGKGGKHMKFHFEVINCSNAGSVYNVHIFAMYEGSDSHSNMALVLPKFFEAIERLQSEEFSLIGHKVRYL